MRALLLLAFLLSCFVCKQKTTCRRPSHFSLIQPLLFTESENAVIQIPFRIGCCLSDCFSPPACSMRLLPQCWRDWEGHKRRRRPEHQCPAAAAGHLAPGSRPPPRHVSLLCARGGLDRSHRSHRRCVPFRQRLAASSCGDRRRRLLLSHDTHIRAAQHPLFRGGQAQHGPAGSEGPCWQ